MKKSIKPTAEAELSVVDKQKTKIIQAIEFRQTQQADVERLKEEAATKQEELRQIQQKHLEAATNLDRINHVINTLASILQDLGVDISQPISLESEQSEQVAEEGPAVTETN